MSARLRIILVLCPFLLHMAAAQQGCGQRAPAPDSSRSTQIFGGRQVFDARKWPWHVKLRVRFTSDEPNNSGRREKTRHCGGTLVNLWTVVTAAHCVNVRQSRWTLVSIQATAGTTSTAVGGQSRYVKYVYTHKKYYGGSGGRHHYDIAVLTLKSSMTPSDYVVPACLPSPDDFLRHGQKCFITGYGRTRSSGLPTVSRLVEASVEIDVDRSEECLDDLVCADSEQGGKICEGDSGGPLVCEVDDKWYVYGVAGGAFRPGRCEYNPSGTYFVSVVRHIANISSSDWSGVTI